MVVPGWVIWRLGPRTPARAKKELSRRGVTGPNSLFKKPVEQEAPGPRGPAMVAKGELVQVIAEVLAADAPVEGAQQPAFEQRGHEMHARHHHNTTTAGSPADEMTVTWWA